MALRVPAVPRELDVGEVAVLEERLRITVLRDKYTVRVVRKR